MGIVQTWDTHVDNWGKLKNTLLPQLDQGLASLMDDLAASGLLDQTLVIVMRVRRTLGFRPPHKRSPVMTLVGSHSALAGAGVRGGR
jgi:hypothetical protein